MISEMRCAAGRPGQSRRRLPGWLARGHLCRALPGHVNTLTIAGAPVDFHAGEPLIHDWLQVLSPAVTWTFYRAIVAANGESYRESFSWPAS